MLAPLGLHSLVPECDDCVARWWLAKRVLLEGASRAVFDTVFLLIAWNTWKHRNRIVFEPGTSPNLVQAKADSMREAVDWKEAGYFGPQEQAFPWSHANYPVFQ